MSLALSRKRVAKNALSQIVTFGMVGGSRSLAAIMVARALGPRGMGTFALSWTLAANLAFLAVLGLDNRLIRELARTRSPGELERSLPLACLLGAGLGGLLVALPTLTGARSDIVEALFAAAGFVVVSAPIVIFRAAFHARERMEFETATSMLEGAVAIAAVAAAMSLGLGVGGAMLGLTAGRVANLALSLVLYRRLWGRLRIEIATHRWAGLIREGWPLAASYALTGTFMRFDILVLALFRPPGEVGVYGAAAVILLTVPLVSVSFSSSLYPILARGEGLGDAQLGAVFNQASRLLIVVALPLATGLSVMAGPIAGLLFGSDFGSTGRYLALLAWVLPFRFVNHLFGVVLAATDRRSRRIRLVPVAILANLVISLLLIPLWGAYGAVFATLATECIIAAVLLWGIRPLRPDILRPLAEGAAVSVVFAGVVAIVPGPALIRLGAGGVVFVAGMAAIFFSGTSDGSEKPRLREGS